jgi:RNA polymerase sigma factor (sigma-70 family)
MNNVGYMTQITKAQPNKHAEFSGFVSDVHPSAIRFASMLLGSHANMAPDVVQKACLSAWRKLDSQREPGRMPGWFRTIILNEVRSYFRWLNVRQKAKHLLGLAQGQQDASPDHGLRARLEAALDTLSLKQREVFVLVYLNDFSVPEAAQVIGCAPGTAKSHLHRAIVKLRDTLNDLWSAS